MIEAVGYVGSAGAATMWIPQALRAWRARHEAAALAGISLTAYAIAVVFNVLLVTYGATTEAPPVVLAGAVNLVCATAIVAVVLGARQRAAR
ncbi:MAG: hypothetical protein QM572_06080 [Nocardioides sp.]|uniref:SemiSWEET family sugar transporter n=1 Tax=Nocardioides sp. TaxID=35761 RepID=UPI0039E4A853